MNAILRSIRQFPQSWFYGCWLLISLVQAAGTELLHDEAYYWVYSKYLDWGYFDHPPMIAVLIKTGYGLFHNELGVRLFMALMNTATIFLIQKMLLRNNDRLFYALILSMGVLQIGGILAVPDIPLAFFTALFFWQYSMYLKKPALLNGILLGLVMALMLYSKYHGILIIFFTFLSNPKLALKPSAWLAAIVGALLFALHLWWQYTHDFPSVQYHLKERNAPEYRVGFTLEYIGGQILLAGPLIGWLLLYAAGKFRPQDALAKALKWSMLGFYGFFLVSTLKGRVEANWTVPALVPLIILAHAWLDDNAHAARWVYRLLAPTLVIILLVRVYMLTDIPLLTNRFKDEMHHNRSWAAAIKNKANGLPVVFMNSYQRPSKYWFYSGEPAYGLNTTRYRRNNFNFWPIEEQVQGKKVLVVDNLMERYDGSFLISTSRGETWGLVQDAFESHSALRFQPVEGKLAIQQGRLQSFTLQLFPDSLARQLLQNPAVPTTLDIYAGDSLVTRIQPQLNQQAGNWRCSFPEKINLAAGEYRAKIGMGTSLKEIYSQNSPTLPLTVKD